MEQDLPIINHGSILHWSLFAFSSMLKFLFLTFFNTFGCVCGYLSCFSIFFNYFMRRKLKSEFPSCTFLYSVIANCIYFLYVGFNHLLILLASPDSFGLLILNTITTFVTFFVFAGELMYCIEMQQRLRYEPLVCLIY